MEKRNCLIVLTILWVFVIFSFSLQPADISSDTSMGFARRLLGMILPGFLDYMEQMSPEELASFHHIVRKGAHFTEYFILGILSHACVVEMCNVKIKQAEIRTVKKIKEKASSLKFICLFALLFCAGIASMDETIQLFVSGRAGRVQDVLLDSAGAFSGILLLYGMRKYIKDRKSLKMKV